MDKTSWTESIIQVCTKRYILQCAGETLPPVLNLQIQGIILFTKKKTNFHI